ncbi:MAG: GNAT family N-acetyltransferase [Clostridia bacterium]|nr:GNAT family N-acetyltransferase [Clostridia bacterium]
MNNPVFIEGERIILRSYKRADAKYISEAASNPKVYATTYNMPLNFTKLYALRWIYSLEQNRRNGFGTEIGVFDKITGEYIGHCGINSISRACSSGNLVYFIDEKFWNKGYAAEAAELMIKYGFEQLGLERISGICMEHNTASRRVMEKVGMKYEGCGISEIKKDGVPVNVLHFAKIK